MPAPIFKYVGGKRWLADKHANLLPDPDDVARRGGTYREAFMGGAAVALALYVGRCPVVLSDANGLLVRTFLTVRDHLDPLLAQLQELEPLYSRELFESYRDALNAGSLSGVDEAVAMFVIIAWGFNGLWRVNKQGKVNTSPGKPSKAGTIPKLVDEANLLAVSMALKGVPIREQDFEEAIGEARPGDAVYLDPVYEPVSKTSCFTAYPGGWRVASRGEGKPLDETADVFRLAKCCERLSAQGIEWALSNSDTPVTRAVFSRWEITTLLAGRSVSSKTSERGSVTEILVRAQLTQCAARLRFWA